MLYALGEMDVRLKSDTVENPSASGPNPDVPPPEANRPTNLEEEEEEVDVT